MGFFFMLSRLKEPGCSGITESGWGIRNPAARDYTESGAMHIHGVATGLFLLLVGGAV